MNDKSVRYLRPLDRSQDRHFEKLAPKNQSAVTELRIALEKTKSRIASLKEANFVKDEVIEEERILRKAAEDRLDNFLVDLYENPEVNSELRQRLPYANKSDPMIKSKNNNVVAQSQNEQGGTMQSKEAGLIQEIHKNERLEALTHSSAQGLVNAAQEPPQSSARSSAVQTDSASASQTASNQSEQQPSLPSPTSLHLSSPGTQLTNSWVSSHTQSSGTVSALTTPGTTSMLTVSTSSAAPYMLPMGPLSSSDSVASFVALPQPHQRSAPGAGLNPLASASLASLAASSYVELPNAQDTKIGEDAMSQKSNFVPNHPEVNSSGSALGRESLMDAGSSLNFGHFPTGLNAQPLFLNPLPLNTPSLHSQRIAPDNVSHISRLLVEIATLKKEKQELEDKLKLSEQKYTELRLGIGTPEDKNNQDLGALIEELRAAEKVRDQTVKKVVQTAQEENKRQYKKEINRTKGHKEHNLMSDEELSDTEDDGSVSTSQSSQPSEAEETKVVGTSDPNEDLTEVASVPSLQDLTEMMQRQRLIMAEELQKVIDERNEAHRSLVKLENKVAALELHPKKDKKVDELTATLSVVRRERDVAVAKLKALMSEMAETKLVYSLHKALWREDQYNETSSNELSAKFNNNRDHKGSKDNNTVSSHFSKHDDTNAKLKARLAFVDQERQLQDQRIKELEQLVKRQRQKLNLMCAGPMMLDGCIETE